MHRTWACLRIRHCGAQMGRLEGVGFEVGEGEGAFEFGVVVATF